MKVFLGVLIPIGAIGLGVWAMRGRGGALHGARHRRGLRGPVEVHELQLFCENDGDLHRQQAQPIESNLRKKMAKGVYNHEKAKKLWGYLAESCAKKYARESGGGPWHKVFSTADRREVAKIFADHFRNEEEIQHRLPARHHEERALPRAA